MIKKLACFILLLWVSISLAHAQDWMPDPNLRQAVRSKLNIPDDIPVFIPDMLRLYALVSNNEGIRSLEGLQYAKNLKFLHIGKGQISDLTPLSGLLNLHTLKLEVHQIVDISPLSKLKNLKELRLEGNSISDLTPLSGLLNLTYLRIDRNPLVVDPNLLNELSNKFPNFPICKLEKSPYQLKCHRLFRPQFRKFNPSFVSEIP